MEDVNYIVHIKINLKKFFFNHKIEEYDMKSHELLLRKIKKSSNVKEAVWNYEIGEAP